jgi:hypothetical protein
MLLRAALALAAKNIAIFPCAPGQKTPACRHGHLQATTDAIVINAWWHENPNYNLAIATGPKSGIFVVDTDGAEAEAALIALGDLPETVTVLTAKGRHRYFKLPPGLKMNCSVRKLIPGVGIDIRAEGGFAVCPPSRHPDGPVYKWVKGIRTFADPPQWLLDKITAIKGSNGQHTPSSEWCRLVIEGVNQGERNDSITRLAGYLLRRYVDPAVVRELIRCWNEVRCRPPLPSEDIDRIIKSIAGREQGKRNGSR